MKTIPSLSLLVLILLFASCENNSSSNFSFTDNLKDDKLAEFETMVSKKIQEYTNPSLDSSFVSLGVDKVFVGKELIKLYSDSNHKRLWSVAKNREDYHTIIEGAYFQGLNPEDYHINDIKQLYQEENDDVESEATRLAKIDVLMSDGILLYAFHMVLGKVDPTTLDPNWNYSKRNLPENINLELKDRLQEQSLLDSIKNAEPEIKLYKEYKSWFVHYDSLQKYDVQITQLEYPGTPLKLGDTSALVLELKNQLKNFDESGIANYDTKFDSTLAKTLINFQSRFGLEPDGVAGKSTFDALNISIKERLDMIRVNMERCRWIDNDLPDEFLLVNIADFQLYLFRNKVMDYTSRVVVGKEHHETPIFTSKIQYVVFNPTWTVPYSIATKETLPRLKKDPNYLGNRNMTLLRNGKEVNPKSVNFSQYSANNFPFTIRQEPGIYNALGRVKFIFPNPYSVYLHDTPSKSYFAKPERTFSHGCVRVQNPLLLAEQLLGNKGYDQQKIKEVLNTNKQTIVHLEKPLKVMLMYWTCYENREAGKMYFYKDVYGRDQKILDNLKKSVSL